MNFEMFLMLLVGVLGWILYMATCRTDDFIRLMKADEERRKAQHERMGRTAGGAVKAGLTAARVFKAIRK